MTEGMVGKPAYRDELQAKAGILAIIPCKGPLATAAGAGCLGGGSGREGQQGFQVLPEDFVLFLLGQAFQVLDPACR